MVRETRLTYEEFSTLLTQIEAIINSRPIIPLSEDPDDLSYLTPSHFLIGTSLFDAPDPDVTDCKLNRLSRWQHIQYMKQHLWKKWVSEYLRSQQQRQKWRLASKQNQPKIGNMVLVQDDNLLPHKWTIGRVLEIHPGADNVV